MYQIHKHKFIKFSVMQIPPLERVWHQIIKTNSI